MKKIWTGFASLAITFILASFCYGAPQFPGNWPWHGIVVQSEVSSQLNLQDLAAQGVNSVEIALHPRFIASAYKYTPDQALLHELQWADGLLDQCKKLNMVGIVSIHGMLIDPNDAAMNSPDFWNDPGKRKSVIGLVGRIVSHFKNRGNELAAYEFISEPGVRGASGRIETPQAWPELMKQIVAEVRKNDAKRFIVVTPGAGGEPEHYRDFLPLADDRIVYGVHMYKPHFYTHQGIGNKPLGVPYPSEKIDKAKLQYLLNDAVAFQNKYKVPIWVGEFSSIRWAPGGEQYIKDLVSIYNANRWGWAYFGYVNYHGWNPDFDSRYSSNDYEERNKHRVGKTSVRWKTLMELYVNSR